MEPHIFGKHVRFIIENHVNERPFSCEHYSRRIDIDHFINFDISKELYETRYLEALFSEDSEVIAEYEEEAAYSYKTGPLAFCSLPVYNVSTIKINCSKY